MKSNHLIPVSPSLYVGWRWGTDNLFISEYFGLIGTRELYFGNSIQGASSVPEPDLVNEILILKLIL